MVKVSSFLISRFTLGCTHDSSFILSRWWKNEFLYNLKVRFRINIFLGLLVVRIGTDLSFLPYQKPRNKVVQCWYIFKCLDFSILQCSHCWYKFCAGIKYKLELSLLGFLPFQAHTFRWGNHKEFDWSCYFLGGETKTKPLVFRMLSLNDINSSVGAWKSDVFWWSLMF